MRVTIRAPLIGAAVLILLTPLLTTVAQDQDEKKEEKSQLPAILKREPLKANEKDDELQRLLKERYNAALTGVQELLGGIEVGTGTFDKLTAEMIENFAKSGIELTDNPADKVAILEELLEFAKKYENTTKAKFDIGSLNSTDLAQATYFRCDTEIKLIRAKREAAKEKKK